MNAIDLQNRPSLAPRVRLQIDPVSAEPVLLFPEGILILNSTAHEVITLCNGQNSVSEVIRSIHEQYEEDEEILRRDVMEILGDLKQRNLIVFSS